ncbi:MAG: right-handed parallel beta-helix repeat-containing protein [Chloroflexota bacterium]
MDSNEQQPDELSDRTITIRLTRDTLILISALVFLVVAIVLAVFFSSGPVVSENEQPGLGQIDEASRITATVDDAATVTETMTIGTPEQGTPVNGDQGGVPYPEPGTAITDEDDPIAGIGTPGPPTFEPERPDNNDDPSDDDPAYPGPNEDNEGNAARPTIPRFGATPTAAGFDPDESPEPDDDFFDPDESPEPDDDFFDPDESPEPTTARPTPLPRPTESGGSQLPTPVPTQVPAPQPGPPAGGSGSPPPSAPTSVPPPTPIPIDTLTGNIRWSADQSPIVIQRDLQLTAGSVLVVDPGVEVVLAPSVSFFIDGSLLANGQPGLPIRFVGAEGQRWEGLFGQAGSTITMDHVEIRGGGNGGTLLTSDGGFISMQNTRVSDNGGHIRIDNSRAEILNNEISGNDMPYGAALDISYDGGGAVTLINNRIGGNIMAAGAPPVQITNLSPLAMVDLAIQSNLLVGQDGPNLVLSTNGPFQGDISCNALVGGGNGLSIRSETLQVPGFALNVRENAIEAHTPPIIPFYLENGIGRGATSEVALDMRNNWWESELGPYHPDLHEDGRGDSVGVNIEFDPWLTERPVCAPTQ